MIRYLLDTNILSDIARNPRGPAARQAKRIGQANFCTSIVVAAELHYGLARRGPTKLARDTAGLLARIAIEPFEGPADEAYGHLRAQLEANGTPIGPNDTLIAAHALALGCVLVTDDENEFRRVPGLVVENWMRP